MDLNSKMESIKRGTLEVVTEEELIDKIKKDKPIAYIGYEPSGSVHLGHAITVKKMIDIQNAGFKVKILLADFHAYLNGKGSLEEIEETSNYNKKCFRALGLSEDTEFILGSSYQTLEDYTYKIYELALSTTLTRAKRSMAQITRDSKDHKVAEVIYPLMQVLDMIFLDVDVASVVWNNVRFTCLQGRVCQWDMKLLFVYIHQLLHGTDGSDKMSSVKRIILP